MTRSIFDPTGPDTLREGGRYTGPDAGSISNMPESAVDGEAGDETQAAVDPALTEAVAEVQAEHDANAHKPAIDASEDALKPGTKPAAE